MQRHSRVLRHNKEDKVIACDIPEKETKFFTKKETLDSLCKYCKSCKVDPITIRLEMEYDTWNIVPSNLVKIHEFRKKDLYNKFEKF